MSSILKLPEYPTATLLMDFEMTFNHEFKKMSRAAVKEFAGNASDPPR